MLYGPNGERLSSIGESALTHQYVKDATRKILSGLSVWRGASATLYGADGREVFDNNPRVGATIHVRLPKRYSTGAEQGRCLT